MSEGIERLRAESARLNSVDTREALGEIERLRADLDELRHAVIQLRFERNEAADEIERLRQLADNLAHHLQGYVCHCNMSKCKCGYDDVMDLYREIRG